MKAWLAVLLFAGFAACKDDPANKHPEKLRSGEMPEPVQQLFRQVARHPDSMGLRLQLVDALDSLGAPKQALGQMDSLLVRDSLNYGLWYRKALLQEHAADTAGALKSYQYAIRVYPAPDALLGAANLLAEQKDSRSLLLCRQVEQLRLGREYTAHCSFISGVYYARTADRAKAIESFNTCINNDMNYTEAYMEKGFLFYENKQFKEAIQVFLTLTRVRNTYADGYYWLAKCYEAQANSTDAIANYRTALTLDPKLLEASAALRRLGVK